MKTMGTMLHLHSSGSCDAPVPSQLEQQSIGGIQLLKCFRFAAEIGVVSLRQPAISALDHLQARSRFKAEQGKSFALATGPALGSI